MYMSFIKNLECLYSINDIRSIDSMNNTNVSMIRENYLIIKISSVLSIVSVVNTSIKIIVQVCK